MSKKDPAKKNLKSKVTMGVKIDAARRCCSPAWPQLRKRK